MTDESLSLQGTGENAAQRLVDGSPPRKSAGSEDRSPRGVDLYQMISVNDRFGLCGKPVLDLLDHRRKSLIERTGEIRVFADAQKRGKAERGGRRENIAERERVVEADRDGIRPRTCLLFVCFAISGVERGAFVIDQSEERKRSRGIVAAV